MMFGFSFMIAQKVDEFFAWSVEHEWARRFFFGASLLFSFLFLFELFWEWGAFMHPLASVGALSLMACYALHDGLRVLKMNDAFERRRDDIAKWGKEGAMQTFILIALVLASISAVFSVFELMHALALVDFAWKPYVFPCVQWVMTLGVFRHFMQRYVSFFGSMYSFYKINAASHVPSSAWEVYDYYMRRFQSLWSMGREVAWCVPLPSRGAKKSIRKNPFFLDLHMNFSAFSAAQCFVLLTVLVLGSTHVFASVLAYATAWMISVQCFDDLFSHSLPQSLFFFFVLYLPSAYSLPLWLVFLNVCALCVDRFAFTDGKEGFCWRAWSPLSKENGAHLRAALEAKWRSFLIALYHEHAFIEALYPALGVMHMYIMPPVFFPLIFICFYVAKSLYLELTPFDFLWFSHEGLSSCKRGLKGEEESAPLSSQNVADWTVRSLHAASDLEEFHHVSPESGKLAQAVVFCSSMLSSIRCC